MPNNAYKRYKKINKKVPGNTAILISREETNKKNALKCNEDTIIRTEIQGIIQSLINNKREKNEILEILSKNERYRKYNIYFEEWIENKMKKVEKKQQQKEK